MRGRRNPFVAREGIPLLALVLVAGWLTLRFAEPVWLLLPALAVVLLYLVFRDPHRAIPPAPLGVVSPVDGKVVSVDVAEDEAFDGSARSIVFRIDSLGTYTARSPVEGTIRDLDGAGSAVGGNSNALWLETDEGDHVVLRFDGYRFGIPPKSIARYGERLGQGQRCAYLRLTRYAELHLPRASRILVEPGQRVHAGSDLVAHLPHP